MVRTFGAGLLMLVGLLVAGPAHAYVYYTPEALIESFFADQAVEDVVWTPDAEAREQLKATLGYPLPRPSYSLHVGVNAEGAPAYAVFDQQLGQHEPIDFGVLLDAQATVRRVEILAYREAYGDGVRGEAFRKQFVGLGLAAPMRPGKDIRIVSGATISTRSISTGVRRACALLAAYLAR